MGKPIDYNGFATTYANTRWAVQWIREPLQNEIQKLIPFSNILEIGCGTGNYSCYLAGAFPNFNYYGFDLSEDMLSCAIGQKSIVKFSIGNAEKQFPYNSNYFAMEFMVDVIHHIQNIDCLFSECSRTLALNGKLVIVTDSEENISRRSLTNYFPETADIEKERYPSIDRLILQAKNAGISLISKTIVEGQIEITDDFFDKIMKKCSSSLRLITEEQFQNGLTRLKDAQQKKEKWISSYSILKYQKE